MTVGSTSPLDKVVGFPWDGTDEKNQVDRAGGRFENQ